MKKWLSLFVLLMALLLTLSAFAEETQVCGDFEYVLLSDGTACLTKYTGRASEVTIPDDLNGATVTAIGDYAFRNHSTLISLHMPETVTTIGSHAFYWCTGMLDFGMSENVTSIGEYAFYYCSDLGWITLPATLEEVGLNAFRKCPNLSFIVTPDTFGYQFVQQNHMDYILQR